MRFLPTNDKLKAALPFGCLFAVLLGLAMAFVIFVGSVMGDCTPGPGCHDHDGARIIRSLFIALPIVIGGAILVWLGSYALRFLLPGARPGLLNGLLGVFTIAAVWFAFHPAFELFFWLLGSS